MNDVLTVAVLGVATIAALGVYLEFRRRKDCGDFDGGWHHENERRITRIQSPYITTENPND